MLMSSQSDLITWKVFSRRILTPNYQGSTPIRGIGLPRLPFNQDCGLHTDEEGRSCTEVIWLPEVWI